MTPREQLPSWQALQQHADIMSRIRLRDLFNDDPQRFQRFSVSLPGLLIDYSKQRLRAETMTALLRLAQDCNVEQWRERLFRGDAINVTENRAALHTLLRAPHSTSPHDEMAAPVHAELARIETFVTAVHDGSWHGFDGRSITDVVNLGVGGSHLGPQTVTEALQSSYASRVRVHYVSNVDQGQLHHTLKNLTPATTLFVVSSKTFTTTETLSNARAAQRWLQQSAPENADWSRQFVAVTAAPDRALKFGIAPAATFRFWDWVGGRFSLWSAIGLPIALQYGFAVFRELLDGAHEMDMHFRHAPLAANAPVILALLAVWNCTFLNTTLHAILPYNQALALLPSYLQQAEMESNGKSTNWNGQTIPYNTVACLWGGLGINGQHAYYQFLHQGNVLSSCDFIAAVHTPHDDDAHAVLLSNMVAQSQALMEGVDESSVRRELLRQEISEDQIISLLPHKIHQGDRVSTTVLLQKLDARNLGLLLALYEHKVFVQGIVLHVYSFDQWGVELGKKLAHNVYQQLTNRQPEGVTNASTLGQIAHIQRWRQTQHEDLSLSPAPRTQDCLC